MNFSHPNTAEIKATGCLGAREPRSHGSLYRRGTFLPVGLRFLGPHEPCRCKRPMGAVRCRNRRVGPQVPTQEE